MDGGGGQQQSPQQTQTQITDMPEWAKPYAQRTLAKGEALTAQPYQTYDANRIAGFSPLQQQAFQGAQQLGPTQQTAMGSNLAAAAGLGALGAGYQPGRFSGGQFTPMAAGQYMSPFVQQALAPQLREAQRQSDIMGQQNAAKAAQMGAFGGSRQALLESERQRNLGMQLGDITGKGLQTAYEQASNQFNQDMARRMQAQQLGEQSRQFGANLGMQGLSTALQSAGQLGALGQQQFAQQQGAIQAQSAAGAQQQALEQQGLTQAYQDFLNQQNYPYKQLGFMSDLIRGMPLGQQSTASVYQAPPSVLGQLGGLGLGAYGLSKMMAKEGGLMESDSYAMGGVTGDINTENILSKLSDAQLARAKQMALNERDQNKLSMIEAEQAERVSMRSGLGGAFNMLPADYQNNVVSAAGGGIIAFADEGLVDTSGLSPEFGGYTGTYETPTPRGMDEIGRMVEAQRAAGKTIGLSDIYDMRDRRGSYGKDWTPPTPLSKKGYDESSSAAIGEYFKESKAEPKEKTAPKITKKVDNAISAMAQTAGVSKKNMLEEYKGILKQISDEGSEDMKSLRALLEKNMGEGKKIRGRALNEALAQFGFQWAAEAAKPGRPGGAITTALSSAAAASPILSKAAMESEKLAREADRNDQAMALNLKQFEIAQRKGDRATAVQLATQQRTLEHHADQLELERKKLEATINYQSRYLGVLSQKAAANSGLQKSYLTGLSRAQDRAAKIAKENWNNPLTQQELKKQGYTTFDQYYDNLIKKEMRRAVPIYGVSPADSDDED